MMSHREYTNYTSFMEVELAVMQDLGYDLDRKAYFGYSIYGSGDTITNKQGYFARNNAGTAYHPDTFSQVPLGIGLHIYGSKNRVTQDADILTKGTGAAGIRIDGIENHLVIPDTTSIHADGYRGTGLLVAYGRDHTITQSGTVTATGEKGIGIQFDFGSNAMGAGYEYRGSYIRFTRDVDVETGDIIGTEDEVSNPNLTDIPEGQYNAASDELNGPLVKEYNLSGTLAGKAHAIYIAKNAFVQDININTGASIQGDITSDWKHFSTDGSYDAITYEKVVGYDDDWDPIYETATTEPLKIQYNGRMGEDGYAYDDDIPDLVTNLNFNTSLSYDGDISGKDNLKLNVNTGTLSYGGSADVLGLAIHDNAMMALTGNASLKAEKASMQGSSILAATGNSRAELTEMTVPKQATPLLASDTGTITIGTLENSGNTRLLSSSAAAKRFGIGTYQGSEDARLTLDLDTKASDELQGNSTRERVKEAAKVLSIKDNASQSDWAVHIAEGDVAGETHAIIGPDGLPLAADEKKNSTASVLNTIAANNFQVFRAQMNGLDKRMGDLRNMPMTDGAWAKVIAGQSQYRSMHSNYKTLQVGADHRIGNFFGGLTAAYTDGDGSVRHGSTDDKNYTFGLYGGWLGDDGQFVDITLKRHHLQTDYDFRAKGNRSKGSYHTGGTSFSLEYGRRLAIGNTNYYIEPQAEFLYGHLNSTGYTTSRGVKVNQECIQSKVGRLGIAAGWVSPEKKGNAYVKASILNDWDADAVIQTRKGNTRRRYHEDMGGIWGEFAIGGTWNINRRMSAYGEMETTAGNPVRTTYQLNAGIRIHF